MVFSPRCSPVNGTHIAMKKLGPSYAVFKNYWQTKGFGWADYCLNVAEIQVLFCTELYVWLVARSGGSGLPTFRTLANFFQKKKIISSISVKIKCK